MPTTPDEIFSWIETQVHFGCRRPGSPAGLKNEVFLEAKLREFEATIVKAKQQFTALKDRSDQDLIEIQKTGTDKLAAQFKV